MTLSELKRAIEKVEHYNALPLHQQLDGAVWGLSRERDAWKAAFEWLEMITDGGVMDGHERTEYDEGMRLVAEKLR